MDNEKRHRHHRRKANPLKIALIVFCAILFVVVVAAGSAWYLWKHSAVLNQERMFVPQQQTDIEEPAPTATPVADLPDAVDAPKIPEQYDLFDDGVFYRLRDNVVAVLFMGIDAKKNQATDSEIVSGTGQADTLLLGVFDTKSGSVQVVHVPRDTEADVKVLDMTKRYVDTERMQICLQHAYGDGGALSCELQTTAVSNLLFGVPINRYVSMGTNGVGAAVNAVGGVELTMLDDFTFYSKVMAKGKTVKLNGKRALVYIQSRRNMREDQTDQNRMKRQMQFVQAFIGTVKDKSKENPALVLSVYEAVKPYLQTNLSLEELLFLANQGLSVDLTEQNVIKLPGTVGKELLPLYHMDEAAARRIAIELFYEEIPAA